MIRAIAPLLLTSLLVSCKIVVISAEGGEVQSTASGTCLPANVCIHEVNEYPDFSETFTAVAAANWKFIGWGEGPNYLCPGSKDPNCTLSTGAISDVPEVRAKIRSPKKYYLLPQFEFVGVPIAESDTITVNGKEWAQPDLFTNLSYLDVNEICPSGACGIGSLNGYSAEGWTWASVHEVEELFNYYLTEAGVPPYHLLETQLDGNDAGDSYAEPGNPTWKENFFNDGWRYNFDANVTGTRGLTATRLGNPETGFQSHMCYFVNIRFGPTGSGTAATVQSYTLTYSVPYINGGLWLYRVPENG